MVAFKHNPTPGVDYTKYQTWPQVVNPDGTIWYKVPGYPGYVYDPILSQGTGGIQLHADPTLKNQQTEQATQNTLDLQQQQVDAAKNASNPLTQLIPVVAGMGGTVGSLYTANKLGLIGPQGKATADAVTQTTNQANAAAQGAQQQAAQQAAQTGKSVAVNAGTDAGTTDVVGGSVGPLATPVTDLSDIPLSAESSLTPLTMGTAGDAAASGALDAGAAPVADTGFLGAALPLGVAALGTFLAGKSAWNEFNGKTDNSIPGLAGRATLDIATGGLAELARPFLSHKTTRQNETDHTKDLLGQSTDPGWQGYVNSMRGQNANPPPDPSMPFDNGKYATWDEYKTAGLQAGDLTGVYGNLNTYGPQWASLTPAQRQAVTQANINQGLYDSKEGEVVINDEDKAKQNLQDVISGKVSPTPTAAPSSSQAGAAAQGATQGTPTVTAKPIIGAPVATVSGPTTTLQPNTPLRTMTRSPGIALNGQRINYS